MGIIDRARARLRLAAVAIVLAAAAGSAPAQGTTPALGATGGQATAPQGTTDTTLTLAGEAALDRLLAVLADDAARAALIAQLEAAGGTAEAPAAAEAEPVSIAQRLATATAAAAADAAAAARRAGAELARLPTLRDRLAAAPETWDAAAALAATILSTIAASLAFEGLAGVAARRLGTRLPPGASLARRAGAAGLALLVRLLAIAAAWAVGYALATLAYGEADRPSQAQILYLNAFAALGLARLALRALANPDAAREPSLSTLPPAAQRTIFLRLAVVGGVAIQGFMFVVPLVRLWAGFAAARPTRTLVATLAAVLTLFAIRAVARALDRAQAAPAPFAEPAVSAEATGLVPLDAPPSSVAAPGEAGGAGGGFWRRLWPPLAVAYVGYAWIVAVTRPALVERIVIGGTLMTALALVLVLAALHLIGRAPQTRAPLPRPMAARLPSLGPRADRLAGLAARALAALLIAVAALLVAAGWHWLDLGDLWARPVLRGALWRLLTALVVAFGAAALWAGVASWIDARLAGASAAGPSRSRTLLALFRNAFTVALAVLAGMIVLSQLGLDIAPLLAGAGVIGLAIGFGAQTLVKDIITGVFIQLENAINEGDVVGVAGITGGVEKVTIRSVRLRTLDGATHIIPFSSVTTVTNLTRDFAFHVAELQVGYREGVGAVKESLQEAFDRLMTEPNLAADILGPLEPPVVVALREAAVLVRTRIKTLPGRQWDVGNRYSEILKDVLDERGVEVPIPSRTILLPAGHAAGPAP